jgi:hypothetical protein
VIVDADLSVLFWDEFSVEPDAEVCFVHCLVHVDAAEIVGRL